MKTVLTILPTLSREYEAGYKSFNQVPLVRPSPPKPAGTEDPAIAEIEEAPTAVGTATNAPALTAENLAALESAENEDKEGAEEEEDGSDGESAEGVGGVPGSCATKLDKNLIYRGSRCFEVLGLDIMIDSKLNPWMIEVNHLPSFGTDSPLDLDIKERLMDEVFNCLPVLPDDEMAYNLHHKAEAEKRLTVERTTASITKMRDKASVEKEREQKEEKERQERVKRRRQRDALYMASQRTLSEERKLVGIPDQVNGLHPQKICITQNKEPTYHQLPRIDQIKFHLKEIYIEKCPDKLNKIDRLLERYETREEEFLTFVCEKYGVTITVPELLQEEDVAEEYPDGVDPDEGEEEDRGRSRDVPGSHSRESSRAADDERSRSVSLDRLSGDKANDKVEKKHSSSVPPVKSAQGPEPPLGTKAGARFGSRSLSPPASTSRRASQWKGGDDEELFKLEVVQQHVPEELDPWMQREMRILKSFTRIFPPEVKQGKSVTDSAVGDGVAAELSKDKDDKDVAEGSDGEDSDDGEDRDEEENETPSAPPTTKPGAAAAAHLLVAHEKKKLASFNDILVEAFLQDRRQTLRLRGPLAHQSRPEKDGNSLPELNSKAAWGSTKASKSSPGAHGWKPPAKPTEGEKKKSDKPGPSQAEVANRLYKGLSSTSPHAAAAASMLSNGSVLAESSMADSLVGHGGGINMDIGGSSGDGLNSYGSVYSSAPQQQGIAFGGAPNVAMGYAPNGSITSASGGPSGGYQQRQSRFVKQNTQPKPGSLWGSTGNYVLDSSPGTSYVPAQFRGHSIAE